MAGGLQIRLYNTDDIPTLEVGADSVEDIVRWRASMAAWALERGLHPFIIGALPNGATAREQLEGLQYLLFGLRDKFIRGMIAQNAGNPPNGPAAWAFMNTALLGGRDEQAVVLEILQGLRLKAGASAMHYYCEFAIFAGYVQPPLPDARQSAMFALGLPEEYQHLAQICDNNPGPAVFANYGRALVQAIGTLQQRQRALENKPSAFASRDMTHDTGDSYVLTSDEVRALVTNIRSAP